MLQLVYPLQAAPLAKIEKEFLADLDKIIRLVVKSICGLPAATVSDMIYAPRKYRGLAAMRCEWEAPLQHFSLAGKLLKVDDEVFQRARDLAAESAHCKTVLAVEGKTSTAMRASLREQSFDQWCSKKWQGAGIVVCKEYTPANNWITEKGCMASSEWTDSLKLDTNYANLRGVPGAVADSNLCRACGEEIETPAHVLGFCKHNSELRTKRHHRVKRAIKSQLERKGYICFEEVFAKDAEGRTRFNDIVAIDKKNKKGYVIDPTVRFERDCEQATAVDQEKKQIYEPCLDFLANSYHPEYGVLEWEVIGLFFGARGMVPDLVVNFWSRFELPAQALTAIAQDVLINSIRILRSHIYSAPRRITAG